MLSIAMKSHSLCEHTRVVVLPTLDALDSIFFLRLRWTHTFVLLHSQDWAREEVLLTEEKPIVGRPMSEIYPDYDVTATEVKRYN